MLRLPPGLVTHYGESYFPEGMPFEEKMATILSRWDKAGRPSVLHWDHETRELMCYTIPGTHQVFIPADRLLYSGVPPSPKKGSTIEAKRGYVITFGGALLTMDPVLYLVPTDIQGLQEEGRNELLYRASARSSHPSPLYDLKSPLIESPPDWVLAVDGTTMLVYQDRQQIDGYNYGVRVTAMPDTPERLSHFLSIIREMATALKIIHDLGLVHTDVSLENFLIVNREGGQKGAQIIDIYHCIKSTETLLRQDIFALGIAMLRLYYFHSHTLRPLEDLLSKILEMPVELIRRENLDRWGEREWTALRARKPVRSDISLKEIVDILSS